MYRTPYYQEMLKIRLIAIDTSCIDTGLNINNNAIMVMSLEKF